MAVEFTKQFEVGSSAIVQGFSLPSYKMLDYFQEVATLHSEHIGYSIDYFLSEKRAWMVLDWDVSVSKYPKWRDVVYVSTWAYNLKGLKIGRSFTVMNGKGETIASALSEWVCMDTERKRPVKPPADMMLKFNENSIPPLPGFGSITVKNSAEFTLENEFSFVVKRSDTDSNRHTNNTKYLEWALDYVPDDVYFNRHPGRINILYRKECSIGDKIIGQTLRSCEDSGDTVKTMLFKDDGVLVSELLTHWI